ncbi:MAG TPA: hypothetical protein VKA04_10755 [Pseudodesulfovibrio sp.]|nr:hypothetical protein [Pseudodesulfovibrio sp.]
MVACTVGELVGFGGIPVLGGVIALWLTGGLQAGERSLVLYVVAVLGGLGEGAVLMGLTVGAVTGAFLIRLSPLAQPSADGAD